MEIASATATRRDVFAMSPTGLAAVAASDMTLRIPSTVRFTHVYVRRDARWQLVASQGTWIQKKSACRLASGGGQGPSR